MSKGRPRFLLHGIGGVFNYGCEAIVRGTHTVLRERWPDCDIAYASRDAANDARALADLDLELLDLGGPGVLARKVARGLLRRAGLPNGFVPAESPRIAAGRDVLLSIGGDIFTLPPPPLPTRPNLPQVDFALGAQRRLPWVLWGASVGPFEESPPALARFRAALAGAALIVLRETASRDYLEGLGLADHLAQASDPAFAMEAESRPEDWPFAEDGPPVLAVNLSPLSLRHLGLDRAEALAAQADTLARLRRELGLRLLLVPHVISADNAVDDDYRHLAAIAALLAEEDAESLRLLPKGLGARRTKGVIARCAGLAAARMHCAIAGASSAVPTLFLAYSRKARGMARAIYDDEDWLMGVDAFRGEAAVERVGRLLAGGDALREHLGKRAPILRADALSAAEHLARLL